MSFTPRRPQTARVTAATTSAATRRPTPTPSNSVISTAPLTARAAAPRTPRQPASSGAPPGGPTATTTTAAAVASSQQVHYQHHHHHHHNSSHHQHQQCLTDIGEKYAGQVKTVLTSFDSLHHAMERYLSESDRREKKALGTGAGAADGECGEDELVMTTTPSTRRSNNHKKRAGGCNDMSDTDNSSDDASQSNVVVGDGGGENGNETTEAVQQQQQQQQQDKAQLHLRGGRKQALSDALITRKIFARISVYRTDEEERAKLITRVRNYNRRSNEGLYRLQGRTIQHCSEAELDKMTDYEKYVATTPSDPHIFRRPTSAAMSSANAERTRRHNSAAVHAAQQQLERRQKAIARHDDIKFQAQAARHREAMQHVIEEWSLIVTLFRAAKAWGRRHLTHMTFVALRQQFILFKRSYNKWFIPASRRMNEEKCFLTRVRWRFAIGAALVWARVWNRRRSARLLLQFCNDMQDAGHFRLVVRKFKQSVVKCQHVVRDYLAYRFTRLALLLLQWNECERQVRASYAAMQRQEKLAQNSIMGLGGGGGKARGGGGKARAASAGHANNREWSESDVLIARSKALVSSDFFDFSVPIPFTVKLQAVEKMCWLERRRTHLKVELPQYQREMSEYQQKLDMWKREHSSKNTFSSGGRNLRVGKPQQPPPQRPPWRKPVKRPFPLLVQADKLQRIVSSTLDDLKEVIVDAQHTAATLTARNALHLIGGSSASPSVSPKRGGTKQQQQQQELDLWVAANTAAYKALRDATFAECYPDELEKERLFYSRVEHYAFVHK